MPRVSVVVTTHNRLAFLKRAIASALAAGDVEVIVVDDASSDGTQEYCRGLDGIRYIRLDKNVRTAAARNAGIEASTTEYITPLDDDDWRLPDTINEQVEILERNLNTGLVFGQCLFADEAGNILDRPPHPAYCPEGNVFDVLLRENPLACMTVVVRKEVFRRLGMFDTSPVMYGIEDWDMWLRIAEHYDIRAVSKPVAVYRTPLRNTGQWSSDVAKQFSRVGKAYKNKWFHLPTARKIIESGVVSEGELLNKVADRILHDMATNSSGIAEKIRKTLLALRCHPPKLKQLTFYKTIVLAAIASEKWKRKMGARRLA
jgi:glycosyltransferase involved in cell wall biosynthesis